MGMGDREVPRRAGPPGRYLRNCWYVAGWADDLAEAPLQRTFLDEPVALFRDADGRAHAIGGRCPHRFAALGHGRVAGGALACPYHGLRFDGTGACVFNPHGDGAVPRAAVPAYPLAERHRLLWIWMGDPARADEALVPDFAWLADPRWEAVRGSTVAEGHYELYSDNILDLSHSCFVHPALAADAFTVGRRRARLQGDRVWCEYEHPDDYLSDGIGAILGRAGRRQDFWAGICWHAPATLLLDFRAGEPGGSRDAMTALPSLHAFTPETAGSTHYVWAVARDFALGDAGFSAAMRGALEQAFEQEDMPVIRDASRLMGTHDLLSLRPVVLDGDAAGLRARRVLERLIRTEEAGAAAPRMAAE